MIHLWCILDINTLVLRLIHGLIVIIVFHRLIIVISNRLNVIIETDLVFWHVATQMGVQNKLKSAGIAAKPNKAYIAFSPVLPKSEEYAQILSNGMIELRKTGKLEKILNKYGLTDWKK